MTITAQEAYVVMMGVHQAMPKTGERHKARWVRDKLLIAWALHHPERIAEFFRATWKPDNTGHIRRQSEGFWIYCNPAVSSNEASKNKYMLAQSVGEVLPFYVEHARSLLLKPEEETLLGMPSNHIQVRLGNIFKRHLGREVTYSELRELRLT